MANLCANPSVDIQLRLHLLETLELRSLGRRRDPAMADYYRFPNNHYSLTSKNLACPPSQRALAAKSQTESSVRTSSRRQQVDTSQQASSTMGGGSVQQQVLEVSFFL